MFFLWPWSKTYGSGPTANFFGRMGYGFFIVIGITVAVYWIVEVIKAAVRAVF